MTCSIRCREPRDESLAAAALPGERAAPESKNAETPVSAVRAFLRLHGYRNFRGRLLDDLLSGLDDCG